MLLRNVVKNGVTQAIDYVDLSTDPHYELGYVYQHSFEESYPNQDIDIAPGLRWWASWSGTPAASPLYKKCLPTTAPLRISRGVAFLASKGWVQPIGTPASMSGYGMWPRTTWI